MRLRAVLPLLAITTLGCALSDAVLPGGSDATDRAPATVISQPPEIEPTATLLVPTPTATEPPPAEPPTAVPAIALPDPSGFRWAEVANGFARPLGLEATPDGRLFVMEQRGVIWVIEGGAVLPNPFLDIRDRVESSAFEQGLLGMAFHPQFLANGFFYVNYTRFGGDTVIARFGASPEPNQADPGSELVLLIVDQPFGNHNGGGLEFGPEGFLYIGLGDGGSANDPFGNGQSLDTLLGKLLRIDIDSAEPYAIPADNPFAAGGGRPEIWAYGLRNPWRFSFDSGTGDLYIGDVGQNSWEEIDFLLAGSPGGVNFGWNQREGRHPFASQATEGLTDPIAEYANTGFACSVTGGVVARDAALPEWAGVYLFGDYCSGEVWGLVRDASGHWQGAVQFATGLSVSSFGSGPDGSVYMVHHGGAIFRLERSG
ncbi:MAG: PQQ-dependent sugar dehydrogenase [Anaerolineales bacterium]